MSEKTFKVKINAIIDFYDVHTGEIKATEKVHNTVVNSGLNRVADLITGASSTAFKYIGLGDNNTAVTNGDTALNNEVKRSTIITASDEGTGIALYDFTFTFGSGESFTIVEAGLFDTGTIDTGVMFNRLTFTGHAVDSDNGVRVRITVTVARP